PGMAGHAAHRLARQRRDDRLYRRASVRRPERHAVRPDRPDAQCRLRRATLHVLRLRRMPMTKHRFAVIALALLSPGGVAQAADPSPREIMEKVTVTRKLDGSEAVVKMTVMDDKKQSRERDITMATKLYDGG